MYYVFLAENVRTRANDNPLNTFEFVALSEAGAHKIFLRPNHPSQVFECSSITHLFLASGGAKVKRYPFKFIVKRDAQELT